MDGFSASLAIKALDGLSMRAEAVAANIANAGTANYRPVRVSFEDALRKAASTGSASVRSVTPQVFRSVDPLAGTGVRLDGELATGTATAGRYQALIEILNRRFQIEAIAVSGAGA